jgi:hypothetical protein
VFLGILLNLYQPCYAALRRARLQTREHHFLSVAFASDPANLPSETLPTFWLYS